MAERQMKEAPRRSVTTLERQLADAQEELRSLRNYYEEQIAAMQDEIRTLRGPSKAEQGKRQHATSSTIFQATASTHVPESTTAAVSSYHSTFGADVTRFPAMDEEAQSSLNRWQKPQDAVMSMCLPKLLLPSSTATSPMVTGVRHGVEKACAMVVSVTFRNIDYHTLVEVQDPAPFQFAMRTVVAGQVDVPLDCVHVILSPGSVIVTAKVYCETDGMAVGLKGEVDAQQEMLLTLLEKLASKVPQVSAAASTKSGKGADLDLGLCNLSTTVQTGLVVPEVFGVLLRPALPADSDVLSAPNAQRLKGGHPHQEVGTNLEHATRKLQDSDLPRALVQDYLPAAETSPMPSPADSPRRNSEAKKPVSETRAPAPSSVQPSAQPRSEWVQNMVFSLAGFGQDSAATSPMESCAGSPSSSPRAQERSYPQFAQASVGALAAEKLMAESKVAVLQEASTEQQQTAPTAFQALKPAQTQDIVGQQRGELNESEAPPAKPPASLAAHETSSSAESRPAALAQATPSGASESIKPRTEKQAALDQGGELVSTVTQAKPPANVAEVSSPAPAAATVMQPGDFRSCSAEYFGSLHTKFAPEAPSKEESRPAGATQKAPELVKAVETQEVSEQSSEAVKESEAPPVKPPASVAEASPAPAAATVMQPGEFAPEAPSHKEARPAEATEAVKESEVPPTKPPANLAEGALLAPAAATVMQPGDFRSCSAEYFGSLHAKFAPEAPSKEESRPAEASQKAPELVKAAKTQDVLPPASLAEGASPAPAAALMQPGDFRSCSAEYFGALHAQFAPEAPSKEEFRPAEAPQKAPELVKAAEAQEVLEQSREAVKESDVPPTKPPASVAEDSPAPAAATAMQPGEFAPEAPSHKEARPAQATSKAPDLVEAAETQEVLEQSREAVKESEVPTAKPPASVAEGASLAPAAATVMQPGDFRSCSAEYFGSLHTKFAPEARSKEESRPAEATEAVIESEVPQAQPPASVAEGALLAPAAATVMQPGDFRSCSAEYFGSLHAKFAPEAPSKEESRPAEATEAVIQSEVPPTKPPANLAEGALLAPAAATVMQPGDFRSCSAEYFGSLHAKFAPEAPSKEESRPAGATEAVKESEVPPTKPPANLAEGALLAPAAATVMQPSDFRSCSAEYFGSLHAKFAPEAPSKEESRPAEASQKAPELVKAAKTQDVLPPASLAEGASPAPAAALMQPGDFRSCSAEYFGALHAQFAPEAPSKEESRPAPPAKPSASLAVGASLAPAAATVMHPGDFRSCSAEYFGSLHAKFASATASSAEESGPTILGQTAQKASEILEPDETERALEQNRQLVKENEELRMELVKASVPTPPGTASLTPAALPVQLEAEAAAAQEASYRAQLAVLAEPSAVEASPPQEGDAAKATADDLQHECKQAFRRNELLRNENAALRLELEKLLELTAPTPPESQRVYKNVEPDDVTARTMESVDLSESQTAREQQPHQGQ